MPEAAATTRTWLELRALDQLGARHRSNHELGDSLAGADGDRRVSQVHKQYFNFAAIVGIHRTGRIDDRKAFFERPTAARAHLALEAGGDFQSDSGRDGGAAHRRNLKPYFNISGEVDPGRMRALVARQRRRRGPHAPQLDNRVHGQLSEVFGPTDGRNAARLGPSTGLAQKAQRPRTNSLTNSPSHSSDHTVIAAFQVRRRARRASRMNSGNIISV